MSVIDSAARGAPPAPRTVLIWGDTQVGKTSLLSAVFYGHPDRVPAVDRASSADALNVLLAQTWRDLCQGRLVRPTSQPQVDLHLTCRNGQPLVLRDIKGGTTRALGANPEARKWLREADACAFLLEWRAADSVSQRQAIMEALDFCGGRPVALLFTKVEQHISADDPLWDRPPAWWRSHAWGRANADLIERFGESVWPTSCFGYHPEQRTPAMVLGEYGAALPFRVQPRGVCEPVEWLLARIGMGA